MNAKVLVSDDELGICHILSHELGACGFDVSVSNDGGQTVRLLTQERFDVLLLDINMPVMDGFQVLERMKNTADKPIIILITAYGSIESAVKAMQLGASDYVTKPFDCAQLIRKINDLLSKRQYLVRDREEPEGQKVRFWGSSPALLEIKNTVKKVKDLRSNVLITGESGTGKGVVAKLLHYESSRSDRPFVYVDCASIQPNLMESTLFGHEKGAFTGAVAQQKGKFELAGDGTIFLDEIGTLSKDLQAHLLVVLQERYFYRIGGTRRLPMSARIVVATNEDLERRVKTGDFREDLYYRLNIIRVRMPPLRDHMADLDELAEKFLLMHAARNGKRVTGFDRRAVEVLHRYWWPGNIRELENAVECAVAMADGELITPQDLPMYVTSGSHVPKNESAIRPPELSLSEQEMMSIINALETHGGHREKTAAALGISRRTLQYKLKKYGLLQEGHGKDPAE